MGIGGTAAAARSKRIISGRSNRESPIAVHRAHARWPRQVFGLLGQKRSSSASIYWMPLPGRLGPSAGGIVRSQLPLRDSSGIA
jgi:hypothetical protein